jgi:hypothetical protein
MARKSRGGGSTPPQLIGNAGGFDEYSFGPDLPSVDINVSAADGTGIVYLQFWWTSDLHDRQPWFTVVGTSFLGSHDANAAMLADIAAGTTVAVYATLADQTGQQIGARGALVDLN